MNNVARVVDDCMKFQIEILSLFRIFSSPDIQRELATKSKELTLIERQYKAWSLHAHDQSNVYKLGSNREMFFFSSLCFNLQTKFKKPMMYFSKKKRTILSRFYFLSNENLIKIFAEARNRMAVQRFPPKIFDGIHALAFGAVNTEIVSMKSIEGEVVSLNKCQALGAVELWMNGMGK
jgi:dynein heavy chain